MKTITYISALAFALVSNFCNAQIAVDDFYSVPVGTSISVNVVINDIQPSDNAMYTNALWGSPNVTRGQQYASNTFTYNNPDVSFLGPDTCYYTVRKLINNTLIYDTAMVIFDVIADSTLLPVADFETELISCDEVYFHNTSSNYNSTAVWYVNNSAFYRPTHTLSGDTVNYYDSTAFAQSGGQTILVGHVTMFVSNQYGNKWKTKNFFVQCTGINEIGLTNISLYPNPTSGYIAIDMSNNDDEITRSYAAIEIYNVLGEKQKAFARTDSSKTANLNVSELPQGMYIATLLSASGERRVLGKFTKE